jgi:D-glycero-alpha-D-manno-heptose-7-phosphate kinase
MIITKTPLRISLVGGGTDIPEFYLKHGGAVISMAIDKYIYVMVNKKFDGGVRVSYSITENVNESEELKHDIVRETLKLFQIFDGIEVVSVADIPGGGSGLGSSSSFAVGLNYALRRYTGVSVNYHPSTFAENSYQVEREMCGHPVGKQDHYAAAYGGFRYYQFNKDDTVFVSPIRLTNDKTEELKSKLMLFWIGKTRHANKILAEQARGIKENTAIDAQACSIYGGANHLYDELCDNNISNIGLYLRENWKFKKQLAMGITTKEIDIYYDMAMEAGAEGGKLCGAGGSGFLLFYAPVEKHKDIEQVLGLRRVPFDINNIGATVVYDERNKYA